LLYLYPDGADCVQGLWDAARQFVQTLPEEQRLAIPMLDEWADGAAVYNNFEISHASVWRDPVVRSFFDFIDHHGGIYHIRWGDAPLRSIAVSLVLKESQLHHFSDVAYQHKPFHNSTPQALPSPDVAALEHLEMAAEYAAAWKEDWTKYFKIGDLDFSVSKPRGVLYMIITPAHVATAVKTLTLVNQHFNQKFKYPIRIFAHGLNYDQRVAIRAAVGNYNIKITSTLIPLDIASLKKDSACPDKTEPDVSWYLSHEVPRQLARRYDYSWRIPYDLVLRGDIEEDPFRAMKDANATYGYFGASKPLLTDVNNTCTVELMDVVQSFLRASNWTDTKIAERLGYVSQGFFAGGLDITHRFLWTSKFYKNITRHFEKNNMTGWNPRIMQSLLTSVSIQPAEVLRLHGIPLDVVSGKGEDVPHPVMLQDVPVKVIHDKSARQLFRPAPVGFIEGEVATAIPSYARVKGTIEEDGGPDTLWLLGKTMLGAMTHGTKDDPRVRLEPSWMVDNAVVLTDVSSFLADDIDDDGDMDLYYRINATGLPAGLFTSHKAGEALQPMSGIWVQTGTKSHHQLQLLVLCRRYNASYSPDDPTGYLGSSVARVINPRATPRTWRVQTREIPGTDMRQSWHSAMVLDDGSYLSTNPAKDKVLVMGEILEEVGRHHHPCRRLARLNVQELLSFVTGKQMRQLNWEMVGGGGKEQGDGATCLFDRKGLQRDRLGLFYHSGRKLWMMGTVDHERDLLVMDVATTPEGPWMVIPVFDVSALSRQGYACHSVLPVPWTTPLGQDHEVVMALLCHETLSGLLLKRLPVTCELVRLEFLRDVEVSVV